MVFVLCMITSFKIELSVYKFNLLPNIWKFIYPGLMLCRLKVCFLGLAVRNKYGLLSRLIWKKILSKGFKKIFSGCQPQSQNFIPLKLYYINYLDSLTHWRSEGQRRKLLEKEKRAVGVSSDPCFKIVNEEIKLIILISDISILEND